MDLLFRPGTFIRVKTPVQSSSIHDALSFSTDDNINNEDDDFPSRPLRPASRVSSYIGLGVRQATPPITALETFPNLNHPDSIYHKPSVDQQAEMLKVVMMNKSFEERVPLEYNSTILHVLEAYQDLRVQLTAKEEDVELLKRTHAKDIKDFEDLAAEWEQKESDYKVELKKLEVLLANTEGGLATVAMARSKSVIHGAEKVCSLVTFRLVPRYAELTPRLSRRQLRSQGASVPSRLELLQAIVRTQVRPMLLVGEASYSHRAQE
jgi:hypothetical protein